MKTRIESAVLLAVLLSGCTGNRTRHVIPADPEFDTTERRSAYYVAPDIGPAFLALQRQDDVTCASLYSNAVALGSTGHNASPRDPYDVEYNAARCYARQAATALAFRFLIQSLETAGYRHLRRNPDFLNRDPDLGSLRNSKEWEDLVEQLTAERRDYVKTVNPRLYELFMQDQLDRIFVDWSKPEEWRAMGLRDKQRGADLAQIVEARELSTAEDYFYAGLMLMHGRDSTNYLRARTLAREAMRLDSSHLQAKRLSAAAQDRYLWSLGRPQWYGTQSRRDENGTWTMEPIDKNAVTDTQRRELNVPSLDEARQRLELQALWSP